MRAVRERPVESARCGDPLLRSDWLGASRQVLEMPRSSQPFLIRVLTVGKWLAGARHWHFAFAWIFTANALVYLAYFFASGAWRERLFSPRRDARNAWETVLHDLRLRRAAPSPVGLYNGMQRLVYTGVLAIAPLLVASGLAIYKPVQLPRLTALLGGYDAARAIHLGVLVALAAFLVVHVVQAVLHPRTLVDMTAGGRRAEA
ncbi:conserved hypothetical protein [Anaeromyxobacter dehalogenans 2CP-C]|uniref:Cytochrome b561 bacterial/Ni-hydrogenase domain-containing protein n=2 Tax=Anaeromyxobacter dehalogenans TaxID=161493 RepID=Q2IKA5_ANADE|nr:conserved hypothetical protein [Anaeromyxobacter dehalogenans 2CP-C]